MNEWMNETFIVFSKDTIINDNATWMVTDIILQNNL